MSDPNVEDGMEHDEDLGEPVLELLELESEPPSGFLGRIVSSIQRRRLASHVATLSWIGLGAVFVELLHIIHGIATTHSDQGGDSS